MTTPLSADLRPGRFLVAACWTGSAILIAAGIAREVAAWRSGTMTMEFGWRPIWLQAEGNLVSWFSGAILLAAAVLLFLQHQAARARGDRSALGWLILAIGFVGLSADEVGQLHEQLIRPLRDGFQLTGYLYLGWVVVAIPVVIALLVAFVPFLLRLPRTTAALFLLSGALYVCMTVGMDLIGGNIAYLLGYAADGYVIVSTLEECLELVAISLFVTVLVRHMDREAVSVRVGFG